MSQCLSFKVMYAPSGVSCIQSLNENFFTVAASGHRFNTTQEECKGVKCKVIPILMSWSSLVSTQTTIRAVILFIDTVRQQVNSCHSVSELNRSTDKKVMLFGRLHEMKINIHRVKQNWMHLVETRSDVSRSNTHYCGWPCPRVSHNWANYKSLVLHGLCQKREENRFEMWRRGRFTMSFESWPCLFQSPYNV